MKNTFFTYEILDKEIRIIEENKESNDSFNTIKEIIKQLRLEGYNQEFIYKGEKINEKMIFVKLDYYDQKNESVVTESGFRYRDTSSVFKKHQFIEGENDIEIFEQFYKLNNRLRYCNGAYYVFNGSEWSNKYSEWLKSDDYKKKSFNLYYGNGIVD